MEVLRREAPVRELRVPVDYARPEGDQVDIGVARLRATDPSRRLGSLVFNFGGPGDAGTDDPRRLRRGVPAAVRARYDLVSFDPRGTGQLASGRMRRRRHRRPSQRGRPDAELRRGSPVVLQRHPRTGRISSRAAWPRTARGWLSSAAGTWPATSTASALRSATSELSYVGFSYGTVIGAVYAQMFPDRVGRMVLDAPVDLSANALEELRANSEGFEQALDEFLSRLRRRTAPVRSATAAIRFGRAHRRSSPLRSRGSASPRAIRPPATESSRRAGRGDVLHRAHLRALRQGVRLALSRRRPRRRAGRATASLLLALADSYNGRADDGTYDNINEVIGVILCDDRVDPTPTFDEYVAEYRRGVAAYPFLGGYVGSTVLGCDTRLPTTARRRDPR